MANGVEYYTKGVPTLVGTSQKNNNEQ